MRRFFIRSIALVSVLLLFFFILLQPTHAVNNTQVYIQATIVRILQERIEHIGSTFTIQQTLELKRKDTGQLVEATTEYQVTSTAQRQKFKPGQTVVITPQEFEGSIEYAFVDAYRVPQLGILTLLFVALTLVITSRKGIFSFISLAGSMAVLLLFTLPQILAGTNPLLVSIISSLFISALVVYPTHGFSPLSHTAVGCMVATLLTVSVVASIAVELMMLSGTGSEEAFFLQIDPSVHINLKGLLLGGIMLATLSVLDDSVISQISVVRQLKHVSPNIHVRELFSRAMEVGKDHVSTLVNTLFLAYAGASLPLFLLFTQSSLPWWVALNDQLVAEEVVRTLIGSIGLILSIPLTTGIAAMVATLKKK